MFEKMFKKFGEKKVFHRVVNKLRLININKFNKIKFRF